MANTLLSPTVIAKEALMQLENNLVMASLVHRAYEDEFTSLSNGNKVGSQITIRKPNKYTFRTGAVAAAQDSVEGYTTIDIDQEGGVDLQFTQKQLTLDIADFGDRYLKPAMITIANQIDMSIYNLYKFVPNWVGTPGQRIDSAADFFKGPERLDELAVPTNDRYAVLSPSDHWGMAGSFAALAAQERTAETALRSAALGRVGGVDIYMAQNVAGHTAGTYIAATAPKGQADTPGPFSVAYTDSVSGIGAVRVFNQMKMNTDTWSTVTMKIGDVFTIANVYDVNPVSRQTLPYLKQFVITADVTSGNDVEIQFSPAIIASGAYQNVSAAPVDGAEITPVAVTASAVYRQNMVFHKNAFALCMVPMELPVGANGAARQSYNGLSISVTPYYDGVNNVSNWRFDVLWGVKAIYPELATRISGTA